MTDFKTIAQKISIYFLQQRTPMMDNELEHSRLQRYIFSKDHCQTGRPLINIHYPLANMRPLNKPKFLKLITPAVAIVPAFDGPSFPEDEVAPEALFNKASSPALMLVMLVSKRVPSGSCEMEFGQTRCGTDLFVTGFG